MGRGLMELAAGQWGLFTTAQARLLGVSAQSVAKMRARGRATRLCHGVYRVAGVGEGPLDGLRAAWVGLAPAVAVSRRLVDPAAVAVVSHRSAAVLHQLGDLDADVHEFRVSQRRQSRVRGTRFHLQPVTEQQWTLVAGLPVTRIPDTIADLAAARTDGGHLGAVVRDAVVSAHVDLQDVTAALAPYAHHYGMPTGDGAGLLRRLLTEAGMPAGVVAAVALTTTTPDVGEPPVGEYQVVAG